jgi:predicted dehydrogenase
MLKTAVIGVGNMGYNHVRTQSQMDLVDLVAVADRDEETIRRVVKTYRLNAYTDYRTMLDQEKPDVVCIALPTEHHREAAGEAIERGIHVLVEKPLAATVQEGQEILDLAASRGVKLMVGHIERFNPAIRAIKSQLSAGALGRLFQLHSRRLSPFPTRIRDVGVVLDLATHEIDAMRYLVGDEVARVYAETDRRVHADHEDSLSGLLRFRNGVTGVLDVNWLTPTKVRQMAVLGERGMYVADYLTQDVYFYENSIGNGGLKWDTLAVLRGVSEGQMVKLHFQKKEPLRAETESFVSAVVDGREPEVTGRDGLAAVELALKLTESGRSRLPVTCVE